MFKVLPLKDACWNHFLFNTVLKSQSSKASIWNFKAGLGKKETKLSLFVDDRITNVENLRLSKDKLLRHFSKMTEYKMNLQNPLYSYISATI